LLSKIRGLGSQQFISLVVFAWLAGCFSMGDERGFAEAVDSYRYAGRGGLTLQDIALRRVFEANIFILCSVYIVIFAFVIGYLAEHAKRRYVEALSIARVAVEAKSRCRSQSNAAGCFTGKS
jgi:hypothetical protein